MTKNRYIPPKQFCSPFELAQGILKGRECLPNGWWTSFDNLQYFHRARTCITFACQYLGITAGSEILVPAYNCGSEIDPMIHMGIEVVMYRVDRATRIDIDDILLRITSKTRAVYVTHYFGWSQELVDLRKICKRHSIKIIEDCALSVLSLTGNSPIGLYADAAVFSLPKFLPVPDGGLLTLNAGVLPVNHQLQPPLFPEILEPSLTFFKRWILFHVGEMGRYISRNGRNIRTGMDADECKHPDIPKRYYYDPHRYHRSISNTTKGLLSLLNIESIVRARRRNYTLLLNSVAKFTWVQPLFSSLPEGVCPVMLPLVVDNRNLMVRWLKARGTPAFAWWSGYHRDLDWSNFPEACYLKDKLLCLPVHQNLAGEHLDHMIECLAEWDKSLASFRL